MALLNMAEGKVVLKTGCMDYVRFGKGSRTMVILPGVGDGLKTVKGTALPFSLMYRSLSCDFTVYVFSRRRDLPEGFTTRDMAEDLARAMYILHLEGSCIVGVSQGGMIAQWLAADHPEMVSRLVLTVTYSRPNSTAEEAIGSWIRMAQRGDYQGIMTDTAERSYSPARRDLMRKVYALMGNVGRPDSFDRFLVQANSCLTHDTSAVLGQIRCPVLVIGGSDDRIVTGEASVELAGQIPDCRLYMYEGLGHALYEEAPDFLQRISDFCAS